MVRELLDAGLYSAPVGDFSVIWINAKDSFAIRIDTADYICPSLARFQRLRAGHLCDCGQANLTGHLISDINGGDYHFFKRDIDALVGFLLDSNLYERIKKVCRFA